MHGHSRKNLSLALKREMKSLFDEVKVAFPKSRHKLIYASLRAQAGSPVLYKIVLDILSADLLFFDVTYPSPNICFELGIAYATNENLFLLLREGTALPSDLAGLTYCTYKSERDILFDSYAEKDIKNAMRKILARKIKLNSNK